MNGRRGLTVDAIVATMLARVRGVPAVDQPVSESLGCVLASPVVAAANLPPWPVATRDGYAVRAVDAIAPTSARGDGAHRLTGGWASRIMTGSPLPTDADAVVPAEYCRSAPGAASGGDVSGYGTTGAARDWVEISTPVDPGQFVALTGVEFEAGSPALPAGIVLGPAELAVLAALGHAHARVVPRPRVAVVATGTELHQAGALPAGKVYASNVTLVEGMVRACGATVSSVRVVPDDPGDLAKALREALVADLILSTGGTGRSPRDLIGKVLMDQEVDSLWDVPVRGSKPAAFRLLREATTERLVPHLALPGRPIGAMVSFIVFAYPLLRRLAGLPAKPARYRWARLAKGIDGIPGHHRYVPVRLERCRGSWQAVPEGESSLYGLAATVGTDGFAVLGPRTAAVPTGHRVRVLLPPWS